MDNDNDDDDDPKYSMLVEDIMLWIVLAGLFAFSTFCFWVSGLF